MIAAEKKEETGVKSEAQAAEGTENIYDTPGQFERPVITADQMIEQVLNDLENTGMLFETEGGLNCYKVILPNKEMRIPLANLLNQMIEEQTWLENSVDASASAAEEVDIIAAQEDVPEIDRETPLEAVEDIDRSDPSVPELLAQELQEEEEPAPVAAAPEAPSITIDNTFFDGNKTVLMFWTGAPKNEVVEALREAVKHPERITNTNRQKFFLDWFDTTQQTLAAENS